MQGKKHYQERLFSTVNLSEMVPENHLLRRIDKAIDLGFIRELTEDLYCADNGRKSIDPELFFRMHLIEYLYGIKSDRQLCEEVHLNLAYRWFCRLNLEDEVPDHSSMTRIRDRFGVEKYQVIFERIIAQLKDKGLIKGKKVMVDASLVEADASINSLEERADGDPDARELKYYDKRCSEYQTGKKKRKVSNQTHVSRTDPDATLVSRPGQYRKLHYKVHYSVDGGSRFIVDCHTTTGAKQECTVLPERIDYLLKKVGMPIEQVVADKGYGGGPIYSFLRENKIRAYIPARDTNMGEGCISKEGFTYDRRNDRYKCPNNQYLYPYGTVQNKTRRYRIIGGHCRDCPLRATCLPDTYKDRSRFVHRSPYQDEIDKIKERQKTNHFKKILQERRWQVEGLFGEAKENHCLRRAKYRGLEKVQIQSYMTAIAQNFKRLADRAPQFIWWLQVVVAAICRRIMCVWGPRRNRLCY